MTRALFGLSAADLAAARPLEGPAPRHRKHWAPEEDAALRRLWAHGGAAAAALATGRSAYACAARGLVLGLGNPNAGLVSPRALAARLGVDPVRVANAAKRLGVRAVPKARQRHGRDAPARRLRALTPRDASIVAAYLAGPAPARIRSVRAGAWGQAAKPWACLRCWRTERPHFSCGLCARCHQTLHVAGKTPPSGAGAGVSGPPDLGPHARAGADVVGALAGRRRPLGAQAVAARAGRFREQVGAVLRALALAGVVVARPGPSGHKCYALALDVGARWWERTEPKKRGQS